MYKCKQNGYLLNWFYSCVLLLCAWYRITQSHKSFILVPASFSVHKWTAHTIVILWSHKPASGGWLDTDAQLILVREMSAPHVITVCRLHGRRRAHTGVMFCMSYGPCKGTRIEAVLNPYWQVWCLLLNYQNHIGASCNVHSVPLWSQY